MNDAEAIDAGEIGIHPPPQALVEVLGPIHIGDRQHHDLELHVHDLGFSHFVRWRLAQSVMTVLPRMERAVRTTWRGSHKEGVCPLAAAPNEGSA